MESVSLKFERDFLKTIEKVMKKHMYITKTEFIREAIRDKIIELKKQEMLKGVDRVFGSSKHKTTDEKLHMAGERAFEILEIKSKAKATH